MKKIILSLGILFIGIGAYSQGLENIIVEKYYVSDANDTAVNADGGVLPIGSVTYRVYVDMLPGYKFQAVFGIPGHEMRIETTTLFFNNEDRGDKEPTYSTAQAANNTVMLDSWLSVGAACDGQFGVLKSDDDGMNNITNNDGVLQNADTSAGIPLTQQDGLMTGSPASVTFVGLDTVITMFNDQNDGTNGPLFSSSNGSWAALGGAMGPDSLTNKVLIAQITTDGVFSFELNIQIGTPSGGVEQYVARDAVNNEILFPALIYTSLINKVPEVTASTPLFTVYPNPSKEKISLEVMSEKKSSKNFYRIIDSQGRQILRKDMGSISDYYFDNIDISMLASGQYFIEVSLDGNSSTRQITKN